MNRLLLKFCESLPGWLALAAISLLQTGCAALRPTTEIRAAQSRLTEITATEEATSEPVFDAPREIAGNTPNTAATAAGSPTAGLHLPSLTMQAPAAFHWKNSALSAGGRPLQYCITGDGTFRTVIVGSTLGNDPAAVDLTEKLARHLHDNSLSYGGFQALVIRTLNPDGEANRKSVNAFGQIINRQFVSESDGLSANCPEADLLRRLIQNEHPDRILHIRTIRSPAGALGSDSDSAPLAASVSQSLSFTRFLYPQDAAVGTLEHYCASQQQCQVITFAFPDTMSSSAAWNCYQDSLLNLVLNQSPTKTAIKTAGSSR
ncbi:MAG: hypothetical protein ACK5MS_09875 [Planctomyces sp.]